MRRRFFFGVITVIAAFGSAVTMTAQGGALADNGDRASAWYERRLAMARGGRQAAGQTGGSGQVDALGLTPEQRRELNARMDRDPRYRLAVIGYLQSMNMLQQTVLAAGEASRRAVADRLRSRSRQVDRMRDRARDQQHRDQQHADKIYERRRNDQ